MTSAGLRTNPSLFEKLVLKYFLQINNEIIEYSHVNAIFFRIDFCPSIIPVFEKPVDHDNFIQGVDNPIFGYLILLKGLILKYSL